MLKRLWSIAYGRYAWRAYHSACKFVARHLPKRIRYYVLIGAMAKSRLDMPASVFSDILKNA